MNKCNSKEGLLFLWLIFTLNLFFQETDVASVTALSEYSHIFVAEPKNIQFTEILRTASGEMTETATNSYPEFPLCLTAKPSNAKCETKQNKTKQQMYSQLHFLFKEIVWQEMLASQCWNSHCIKWKYNFTHYIKCNLSFRTVVTEIFIISSKNLPKKTSLFFRKSRDLF